MEFLPLSVLLVLSLPWPVPSHKSSFSLNKLRGFSWENCDDGQDPVVLTSLVVEPVPISIPGNVTVSMESKCRVPLTSPLQASVTLEKETFPGSWWEIPCIKNFGSCFYPDLCNFIDSFIPPGEPCPEPLHTYGLPCHCPFKKGTYSLPKTTFQIPPVKLPSFFSKSNYRARLILMKEKMHLGCFKVNFSLTNE